MVSGKGEMYRAGVIDGPACADRLYSFIYICVVKMENLNMPENQKTENYWELLYDGECPLCTRFAAQLRKFDRHGEISIIPLQDYEISDEAAVSYHDLMEDVHMLGRNGECLVGGDVVQQILLMVPQMKPFRWMLKTNAGRGLSRALYSSLSFARGCSRCRRKEIRKV